MMVFASIPFLFIFLPVVLVIYILVDRFCKKARNLVLLVFSLLFYSFGEPKYALLMLITITYVYGMGILIDKKRNSDYKKFLLFAGCFLPLAFLAFFKYTNFALDTLSRLLRVEIRFLKLVLPVGISFYTFQAISYMIDVYRDEVAVQKNWINLATYVVLFPQLIAGPIVRCKDVAEELKNRSTTLEGCSKGIRRFTFGLGKKVLLANQLDVLCVALKSGADTSVLGLWMYAIAFSLQIYLDFSGYSDMAIGLGNVFGFRFPENFDYPYISSSVTEFWRRWHMTLGGWFRDYVYIPLGGNRVSKIKWVRNLLTVWLLTGLWHGAGWNFLIWGLWYGILLGVEKLWLGKLLKKIPGFFGHVYTLLAVIFGFVIFNAETMTQAIRELGGMTGFGGLAIWNTNSIYQLKSFSVLLLLSLTASTPIWKKLVLRFNKNGELEFLETPAVFVVLLLCTAYLASGAFNPFLYFRF